MEDMKVKVLLGSTKGMHPQHDGIALGKYKIEPIPNKFLTVDGHSQQFLLSFNDKIEEGTSNSNPLEDMFNHLSDVFEL